jgi:RNA polymerase sigma factor (sigma-70 family)
MRVDAFYSLPAHANDAALMRRMQGGDERAFETIFKRHQAPLLSYCRHMLSNQDEGEDALQQAFIKAHQALLHGTAPRELRPWLYAIARNCCLSAIAARRPTTPLADHTPALAGLSDQVRQREDLRELLAGIGRLPEDQRSALLLAELDDLPHQAIATIVGCPVSKVKALIYQARSALIADRDARSAPCQDIREQLSVAHGGELRRGPLRRHLKLCVGCHDFQLALSAQRQSLAAVLPVLPSAGLAAAILGHGAAHAAGAASIGGAGAGAGAGAGGAGVGATATGGTGIAATGTVVSTAATSTAVGAGAAVGGGTGIGALVGGGVITKLAVGGAVLALATAGAVTVHHHEAQATPHHSSRVQLAFAGRKGRRISATDISYSSSLGTGSPSALHPGSAPALTLVNGTGATGSPGTEPSVQLSGLGGANPLLTPSPTLTPSTASPGSPGQPAVSTRQSKSGAGRDPAARAKHRAALHRRRARLRHRARLRRRALLRREALLRRQLAAQRRARREALERRRLTAPKPPVTPAPVRAPHRKARTTPASGTVGEPAETQTTPSTGKGANGGHRHPPAGTGTGTGTGATGTGTTGTGTGAGKTGSGKTGSGTGAGKTGTGATGAGKENAGSTTGAGKAGSGTGTEKAGSGTGGGKTGSGKTSSGTGTGAGAGAAGETTGTGETRSPSTPGHPKKPLVEEEQLPNL